RYVNRVRVGWRPARIVIQVLVASAEGEHTGRQGERGRAFARTPGENDGERVLRPGIGKAAVERDRAVLVDRGGAENEGDIDWRHVVDRHTRVSPVRTRRSFDLRYVNRVRVGWRPGRIVIQVLVAGAEVEHAGRQGERGRAL